MNEQLKGAAWGAILAGALLLAGRGCDATDALSPQSPTVVKLNGRVILIHDPEGRPLQLMVSGESVARTCRHVEVSIVSEPSPPKPDPVDPVVPKPPEPPKPEPTPTVPPAVPVKKATRATYIYEQRAGNVPPPVAAAISKLNAGGFVATCIDQHTFTRTGQVPVQYDVALTEAKKVGIPCLIIQAGDVVLRVVKNPKTTEQVMEAVK